MAVPAVRFRKEALADLKQLDPIIAQRLLDKLRWLSEHWDDLIPERLSGEFRDCYKLRVGDWRIVYRFQTDTIIVHLIGHRRDIYKR